ncbi:MAG TPA: ATP-binding protein [Kiritimatiellia bacterium]|nr:ATP-binding protein [Kiritimatiellia bacterium]HSA19111.1 ATP-binding protein [Kiritimatiellia bacterium]
MLLLAVMLGLLNLLLLGGLLALHHRQRRLARALAEARLAFERWAGGDLDARMVPRDGDPPGQLAAAFNGMAAHLAEQIRLLEQQRDQQEAVFVSMVEGVVALDNGGRILRLNEAAARLFDIPPDKARNRLLQELVRNPALHQLVADAVARGEPAEDDITVFNGRERHLRVRASRLRDAQGEGIGALVVFHDVTRLRRLESVRRDFVANVSHELKTPITSIKGFIETLQDGALKSEEEARRFLGIMARQADRLNAIIEDLLQLSRIEEEADQQVIRLEEQEVSPVLRSAVECCQYKADARQMAVELDGAPGLRARFNTPLLEQAVINLLDNAIKYSPSGSPVRVEAGREGADVVIRVRDRGPGIPPEHLPRLFERFYRVDKARSRQMGGTGLGLAIVKHIAQAHGGNVSVESIPGQGSVFSLRIPA